MKTMGKRILALALTLCLVLALGTTAHAAVSQITATVGSGEAQAGKEITTINVNTDGDSFNSPLTEDLFTVDGTGVGLDAELKIQSVSGEGTTTATLTMESPIIPLHSGDLSVTAKSGAFSDESAPPAATISVTAADKPTISCTSGDLTAGKAPTTITLSVSGNEFSSTSPEDYTLTGVNGLNVTSVTGGATASLSVSGVPETSGTLKVSVAAKAFKYQYQGEDPVTCDITVNAPTVTATVTNTPITVGKEGEIVITANGSNFKADLNNEPNKFTLEGCGVSAPTKVVVNTNKATLTVKPTSSGTIKVTQISADAFQYQPASAVTLSDQNTVTVSAPTGDITKTLVGDGLYVDTALNGQKITLDISSENGLEFKTGIGSGDFSLGGAGKGSLVIQSVERNSATQVTLTLGGTVTASGDLTVTANKSAFEYQPDSEIVATNNNITVNSAPSVSLTGTDITAGDTNQVTVTISGGDAKFASGVDESKFSVSGSGIEGVTEVTNVTITDSGTADKTAQITLNAVPTTAGSLTIKVQKDAFTPVAAGEATATVTVSAPTGGVNAALEGGTATLTAGTAAGDTKIKLTATDTLNFKNSQASENFTLENGTGDIGTLAVSGATYNSDKSVTLTLTGIPKAGGDFTVKVKQDAFVAQTQDPADITATGSLTIAYPKIELTADPSHIIEDTEVSSITLTAKNGAFNAIDTDSSANFTFTGNTDIKLTHIKAVQGSNQATLTVTGKAESTTALTINVKKAAFVYAPETEPLTATVTVGPPTGNLSAKLNGNLYAGTAADGATITLTITGSQGLHFKDSGLTIADFELVEAPENLSIGSVTRDSETQATLTLSGTPTASGSFQVKALKDSAFMAAPADDKISTESITVGDPNVALTVSDNTLQAGAKDSTVTLTLTGSTFADDLTDKVTLVPGEDYADDDLSIEVNKEDDTTVTVTVKGVPSVMGKISFEFKTDAFTPAPTAAVTVAVDVAKGEQAAEAEANPGAPGIGFTAPLDQLAAAVLTPDEQALYEKGAEVKIELVESVGAQIPQTDKTAVEAAVGDYTVGEYLDVSLVKSVNGVTGDITETKTPIQVVFTIPTDLRAANRSFAVIRVHDGTATLLEPVASTAETITVESSLFSTYAIVYREVVPTEAPATPTEAPVEPTEAPVEPTEAPVEPTETPVEPTEAPDATEAPEATDAPAEPTATPAGTEAPKAPDTGDGSMPGLWMGLLAVCAAGLVLTLIQLRRRARG